MGRLLVGLRYGDFLERAPMTATILLVHGACHGPWCWERVVPMLEQRGHRVVAPSLPGRGSNAGLGWRYGLSDYATHIIEVARAQQDPVVAVGHSMGGMVISAATEAAPELFSRLVFVSGFLPRSGDSLASIAAADEVSDLGDATTVSWLRGVVTINRASLKPVYAGDCSESDIAFAAARICPEPVRPSLAKVTLSEARFGRVPRSFIRCTRDRALSLPMQDRLIARQPCEHVATLDASHSPFLSMPDKLANAMLAII
jgi:pimeloyl-ACP methyl ester carboxylesterase